MANARLPDDPADETLNAARDAALLNSASAPLALAHGEALLRAGLLPSAIGEIQRALRLDYQFDAARFALGCAWLSAGEPQKALEAFSRLDQNWPRLAAKLDEANAMSARPRSDAGYVRHLFDQFAPDYDTRMIAQLSYAAPQILRELADLVMPGRGGLAILDLGCGTGLTGLAFRDMAARLDGIDLSPTMIEKARARGLYDALAVADIEARSDDAGYDLLLAADTLVYLGDLRPVFARAARSLRREGFFLFTVERKEGDGFELGPKRRWRHSEPYLRDEAARAGFEIAGLVACAPRHEANQPVEGLAVALSRTD
jgi:predicted TPR repeat methyltransferase